MLKGLFENLMFVYVSFALYLCIDSFADLTWEKVYIVWEEFWNVHDGVWLFCNDHVWLKSS